MADNTSLDGLISYNLLSNKIDASPTDPPTPQNTHPAAEINSDITALNALKAFLADINDITLDNKNTIKELVNSILSSIGTAPVTLTREVGADTYTLAVDQNGSMAYSRNGAPLFQVATDGTVTGNVLTAPPSYIDAEVGADTYSWGVGNTGDMVYAKNGTPIKTLQKDGTFDPPIEAELPTIFTPLMRNPQRVRAVTSTIPIITAGSTITHQITFPNTEATEGFLFTGATGISLSDIEAGRIASLSQLSNYVRPTTPLPNSRFFGSNIGTARNTLYVNSNYLKSARFFTPLPEEYENANAQLLAGWNQSYHSADVLIGHRQTSTGGSDGVFQIDKQVQLNKAYLTQAGSDTILNLELKSVDVADSTALARVFALTY